jgi:hypothetical protein
MIERMAALMQAGVGGAQAPGAPAVARPEELIARDLSERLGARALLVEARQGEDGRARLLAVLDADAAGLAAEARRLEAADQSAPAVEVVDRATWALLQRLQASGLIRFVGEPPRRLHHSPALDDDPAERLSIARAVELRGLAERALRKAQVLAGGGFPEEVAPLLASVIRLAAAARLVAQRELPPQADTATAEQVRMLVARQDLSRDALDILEAAADAASVASLERMLQATAEIVAACHRLAKA